MWQNFKGAAKRFLADDAVYFSLLLVVIAIAAFGLGRMTSPSLHTVGPLPIAPIVPEKVVPAPPVSTTTIEVSGEGVVASKSGTKYHLPWCPGAQQMKEENKIYFATRAEAEAAGYTPASNCKGL